MKNLFLIVAVALFSSCSLKPISFGGVQDSKVNSLTQKGVEAEFGVKIKNPNKFGFRIYKTDLDVTVNGISLGKAGLKKKVKIKANSDNVSTFVVSSDFSKLNFTELPKLMAMANGKNVTITVKGALRVGNLFYKKTFPLDISQKVNLSK